MSSSSLLIELDSIDSTNNYAMQLIDADKAQHGLTITADSQTGGKGQRGRTWLDTPGQSLLMSIIAIPRHSLRHQFQFSAAIAVAIANVLQNMGEDWQVHIKWPNDIIVNDKKAGGILIENVLRGSDWAHSVIGLGLNINQQHLPDEVPHATSLRIASGSEFNKPWLRDRLREQILQAVEQPLPEAAQIKAYNDLLYKHGGQQLFGDAAQSWQARILSVTAQGLLEVQLADGSLAHYVHGQVTWHYNQHPVI